MGNGARSSAEPWLSQSDPISLTKVEPKVVSTVVGACLESSLRLNGAFEHTKLSAGPWKPRKQVYLLVFTTNGWPGRVL